MKKICCPSTTIIAYKKINELCLPIAIYLVSIRLVWRFSTFMAMVKTRYVACHFAKNIMDGKPTRFSIKVNIYRFTYVDDIVTSIYKLMISINLRNINPSQYIKSLTVQCHLKFFNKIINLLN